MRRASRTWRWIARRVVPAVAVAVAGAGAGAVRTGAACVPRGHAPTPADAALLAWMDRAGAGDSVALDSLQACFAAPAGYGSPVWQVAATILQQHPHPGRAALAPRGEPGERLVLRGTVRDASGHPVAGAVLHIFQTDATGAYTPVRPMDEPHARLSAWITTGTDGRYAFDTIRPGGYPKTVHLDGQDRKIPAHIHYDVRGAAGHAAFQLVFADDPRLDAHWREWAHDGGHPIAVLQRGAGGTWTGTQDVTLQP